MVLIVSWAEPLSNAITGVSSVALELPPSFLSLSVFSPGYHVSITSYPLGECLYPRLRGKTRGSWGARRVKQRLSKDMQVGT